MPELRIEELSSGDIVLWDEDRPHETALVYYPPDDKIRYHNSP